MSIASICATHSADIYHASITGGSMGLQTRTYPTAAYSGVVGTLQLRGGRTVEQFSKQSMIFDAVFYTPTALTVQTGDRAVIANTNYNIVVGGDNGGRGRLTRLYLQRKD